MAKWSESAVRRALEWFADYSGSDVIGQVPVSRPGWRGWSSGSEQHVLEGVAIPGTGRLLDWDEEQFERVVVDAVLRPIVAYGFADRPVLGRVVVLSAMLTRAFPGHGPIRPSVLVAEGKTSPNTASAYHLRGIDIIAVPEEALV